MTRPAVVRALRASDLALMRRMLDMFGRAFDEPATYSSQQPGDDYLRQLLSAQTFIAIAALDGDDVIRGLAGYVLPKFEQARAEFYIYDLAVDAAHRRCGAATALIQELQRQARRCGSGRICVQADRGDDPAIALYSRLGRREDVLHFDIAPADA